MFFQAIARVINYYLDIIFLIKDHEQKKIQNIDIRLCHVGNCGGYINKCKFQL